jgi:hypothetical protein
MDSSDSVCKIFCLRRCAVERFLLIAIFSISTVGIVRALSQSLQIGANDITNPADFVHLDKLALQYELITPFHFSIAELSVGGASPNQCTHEKKRRGTLEGVVH